jgi:hypothetical protein
MRLPALFWAVFCCTALIILVPAAWEWTHPQGEFSGLAVFSMLLVLAVLAVVAAVVAVVRKPLAYGIGLVLVALPLLWWSVASLSLLGQRLTAPGQADQDAGRGYFTAPADRALAEAIVAGNAPLVATLAPAADLDAAGWGGMTFMRLTLEQAHADPAILGALLRAGIDPDQDASALYRRIYEEKNEALLRLVIESGVDLNRHMGRGQWFLFIPYDWPEGLALVLDHGADTEAQDAMGYTPIMRAARIGSWPAVELLLAHGARTDHVSNSGESLRDILTMAIAESPGDIPPRIAALQAGLSLSSSPSSSSSARDLVIRRTQSAPLMRAMLPSPRP